MKKHYSLFALLTSAALLAGAAFTGGAPKEALNADEAVVYTEFGYDNVNATNILGDWEYTGENKSKGSKGSGTINGQTYSDLRIFASANCVLTYNISDNFDYQNVRRVKWSLHALKTTGETKTNQFTSSCIDIYESVTDSAQFDEAYGTASGVYNNFKNTVNVDQYSYSGVLSSATPISKVSFDFGSVTIAVYDIRLTFEDVVTTTLQAPEYYFDGNTLHITRDENATGGYEFYTFYKNDEGQFCEYGDLISVPQPVSGDATYTFTDMPQFTEFYVKCRSVGDSIYFESSDFGEFSDTYFVNYEVNEISVAEFSSLVAEKTTDDYHRYYKCSGTVTSVSSTKKTFKLIGAGSDITINCNVINPNDRKYDLNVGDDVTVIAYKAGQYAYSYLDSCVIEDVKNIQVGSQLSFSYSYKNEVCDKWQLVKSLDELVEGETYAIASGVGFDSTFISKENNINNRKTVDVNVNNDGSAIDNENILRLNLGGNKTDGYTFNTLNYNTETNYYLNATDTNSYNHLKVSADIDEYAVFDVSINADYSADIICKGKGERNVIRYNKSSNLYSCYTSTPESPSQYNVYIYKLIENAPNKVFSMLTDENGNNLMKMSFGVNIPTVTKVLLNEFGLTELGFDYLKGGATEYTHRKLEGAYVLEQGANSSVTFENSRYFQYRLSITKIPSINFSTEIKVKPYFKIGDTCYYGNEIKYSVNSLADKYLTDYYSSEAVQASAEVLHWLSQFNG